VYYLTLNGGRKESRKNGKKTPISSSVKLYEKIMISESKWRYSILANFLDLIIFTATHYEILLEKIS